MDVRKIRESLNNINSGKKSGESKFWSPKNQKTEIRIVPYKFNQDNPLTRVFIYYKLVQGKTIVSPKTIGQFDPIIDKAIKLMKTGNEEDKQFAKDIQPSERGFVPIIVRGEQHLGTRFWSCSGMVLKQIEKIVDKLYNSFLEEEMTEEQALKQSDITDLEFGTDLYIQYTPKEKSKTKFSSIEVTEKRKQSPILDPKKFSEEERKELLDKILNEQLNLSEMYKPSTKKQLEDYFEAWLSNFKDDEETTEQTEQVEEKNMTDVISDLKNKIKR